MEKLKNILVVGGTHGNEMTGISLLQYWANSDYLQRPGLNIDTLLANPQATQLGRRYVDYDLNRAFTKELLDKSNETRSEDIKRAREIAEIYSENGSKFWPDMVIDIHNSTANMGLTLIINNPHPITRSIVAHLAQEFPMVKILQEPILGDNNPYLASIGKLDLTVEIGPQPHGTLNADLFFSTEKLVQRVLDLIVQYNENKLPLASLETTYFEQSDAVDYPRNSKHELDAMIHPNLWGADYQALEKGAKVFVDFSGNAIQWKGETTWPCFIGEVAYLEKIIAFIKTDKKTALW